MPGRKTPAFSIGENIIPAFLMVIYFYTRKPRKKRIQE
jgi:hypothetical protein